MVKARSLIEEGELAHLGSSDKPEPWGSAWKELEGFIYAADLKRWRASPEV